MKKENEMIINNKLTIFKPPSFIYKLCKSQQKQLKNSTYQIHQNDAIRIRKYHHSLNNNQQFAIYQWRKNVEQPVVKVLYVQLCRQMVIDKQNKNIWVNIYTEHLEKTLADIINFNINQALYLFRESLIGYQAIFTKFSAVSIHKSYIGLNAEGKLKVWLSQNLAFNYSAHQQNANQYFDQQIFNSQFTIVRKIIHMMTLLSAISCKGFFTELSRQLQIKKYSFSNCLQYINHFASIANKIQIPENLQYLLQKRINQNLQKSTFKMTNSRKINNQTRQRKLSQNLNEGIKTFKHFATVSRFKENTQKNSHNWQQKSQTTYKFQQNSQNNSKDRLSFIPRSKSKLPKQQLKQSKKSKQEQISLHLIVEKNDNRNKSNKYFQAQKGNNCLEKTKSNSSLARHRPSISLMPTFLIRISNPKINQMKESLQIRRINKSISATKRNSVDAQSLFHSKAQKSLTTKMLPGQKLVISQAQNKNATNFYQLNPYDQVNPQHYLQSRGRSASQSVKLEQSIFPRMLSSMHQRRQQVDIQRPSRLSSQVSGKQQLSIVSTLSNKKSRSSNQKATQKTSFLTKTNNESSSSSQMNFSCLSMQNKTIQPFPLNQLVNKSLVKYGFQGILDNPSCQQVDQEQSKSYNSSELKNTHNLADFIYDKENNIDFNQNWSFGNNSNHLRGKLIFNDDSEHTLIKQKNDQLIIKNQWRKTINNLQMSGDILLNQSIIDCSEDIIERDNHPQIKLEKLDRLGGDMCFSIVRKSDDISLY